MCCSPAATRFGTRRSSRRPVRPGVLRGLLPQAEDRLCPILWHPPHPGRHGGGAADLSGVLLPLVRPGAAGAGHCPGHHREGRAGGAGSHAAAGENGLGGRGQGRRRGRGYILCYCISRPDALAPYIRAWRRDGLRWCSCAAYARRSTPRPAAFSAPVRRSFWVCSGMPPMCAPTPSTERCSPSSSKSPSLRRWHRQRWLRRRVPGPSAC